MFPFTYLFFENLLFCDLFLLNVCVLVLFCFLFDRGLSKSLSCQPFRVHQNHQNLLYDSFIVVVLDEVLASHDTVA